MPRAHRSRRRREERAGASTGSSVSPFVSGTFRSLRSPIGYDVLASLRSLADRVRFARFARGFGYPNPYHRTRSSERSEHSVPDQEASDASDLSYPFPFNRSIRARDA